MTVLLIGVFVIAGMGSLASFALHRSPSRRHLLLTTCLFTCCAWPAVPLVREFTGWTSIAMSSADTDENPQIAQGASVNSIRPPTSASEEVSPSSAQHPNPDLTNVADQSTATLQPLDSPDAPVVLDSAQNFDATGASATLRTALATSPSMGPLQRVLFGVYFLGGTLLSLRFAIALYRLKHCRRRATPTDLLSGNVPILEADVAVPIAYGLGRWAILIPRGLENHLSMSQMQDVIMHEIAHLRRGDLWCILVQRAAAIFYWPIPSIHLLNRSLMQAREEICDNAVLDARDPLAYGDTLLAVARYAIVHSNALVIAPSFLQTGELERRVAGLLDGRRDRRTDLNKRWRYAAAAAIVVLVTLCGTTRVVAVGDKLQIDVDRESSQSAQVETPIHWTEAPTVDADQPALHRGVVIDPDGRPVAGAKIFAASSIELLQIRPPQSVSADDLGLQRAVTDSLGRFEFEADDLTWVTPAGVRKRWEALLVATAGSYKAGWIKVWGQDRTFRSHRDPGVSGEIVIRLRPPAALRGTLQNSDGHPLVKANLTLTGLFVPSHHDLDQHIAEEEQQPQGLFAGVDYAESLNRPSLLPGLTLETTTDTNGLFEFPGLPEGYVASIQVEHPEVVTTTLRAAVRKIENVCRQPFLNTGDPKISLYGSGFTAVLEPSVPLRGKVSAVYGIDRTPAAGVSVALANHNSANGWSGPKSFANIVGQFEVTGLPIRQQGHQLAFFGNFDAPYRSSRVQVIAGQYPQVELLPAAPFRLRVTDPTGQPLDREVFSVEVQTEPDSIVSGVQARFNNARRVAPGIYEGIVPIGPGAILVRCESKSDRPAAVDPKAFFEPGRTDWTYDELRYRYGDAWRIATIAVKTTDVLAVAANPTIHQGNVAAVRFTNARPRQSALEFSATVFSDPPVQVSFVDDQGLPVSGVSVVRQIERYNFDDLPSTAEIFGLHPERAEVLWFSEPQRGLMAAVVAKWTEQPLRIQLKPAAVIQGRLVDNRGPGNSREFGIRLQGEAVLPDTLIAPHEDAEQPGDFRMQVPPEIEVSGELVRRTHAWATRPAAAAAFGPLTLQSGEIHDLDDLPLP